MAARKTSRRVSKTKKKGAVPARKPKGRSVARAGAKGAKGAKPAEAPGHGVFIWHEVVTPDVSATKRFYTSLFGWTFHDMPMGDYTYTLFNQGGKDFAGCMVNRSSDGKRSPPMWLTYIAVPDVDASASKAASLGARVIVPATDIPGVGRFSVLEDTQGAVFALFRPAM